MSQPLDKDRRPIASRNTQWAQKITDYLVKIHASPNNISLWSIFFAIVGGIAICFAPKSAGIFIFAICILLRLLSNLFDGMVAIKLNKPNPLGRIYNEFPDRITDTILIVAAGYASNNLVLSLFGAMFAVATAYVRIFGGSLGFDQDFSGPLSKSQRMGVLMVASIIGQLELWLNGTFYALTAGLAIITVGSLLTCVNRTNHLTQKIQQQESEKNAN